MWGPIDRRIAVGAVGEKHADDFMHHWNTEHGIPHPHPHRPVATPLPIVAPPALPPVVPDQRELHLHGHCFNVSVRGATCLLVIALLCIAAFVWIRGLPDTFDEIVE